LAPVSALTVTSAWRSPSQGRPPGSLPAAIASAAAVQWSKPLAAWLCPNSGVSERPARCGPNDSKASAEVWGWATLEAFGVALLAPDPDPEPSPRRDVSARNVA